MLSVHYAEWCKQAHYAECSYAECCNAECRGAMLKYGFASFNLCFIASVLYCYPIVHLGLGGSLGAVL
jgi:hypothetical protein